MNGLGINHHQPLYPSSYDPDVNAGSPRYDAAAHQNMPPPHILEQHFTQSRDDDEALRAKEVWRQADIRGGFRSLVPEPPDTLLCLDLATQIDLKMKERRKIEFGDNDDDGSAGVIEMRGLLHKGGKKERTWICGGRLAFMIDRDLGHAHSHFANVVPGTKLQEAVACRTRVTVSAFGSRRPNLKFVRVLVHVHTTIASVPACQRHIC